MSARKETIREMRQSDGVRIFAAWKARSFLEDHLETTAFEDLKDVKTSSEYRGPKPGGPYNLEDRERKRRLQRNLRIKI